MELSVRAPWGNLIQFRLQKKQKIRDAKRAVSDETGFPAWHLNLIWEGINLSDSTTLNVDALVVDLKVISPELRNRTPCPVLPMAKDWRDAICKDQAVMVWSCCFGSATWSHAIVRSSSETHVNVQIVPGGPKLKMTRRSRDLQPAMKDRGMTLPQLRRFEQDCRRACEAGRVLDTREFLDREKTVRNPGYNYPLNFDLAPAWLVVDLFVRPATCGLRVPFVDTMSQRWPDLGGPRTTTHFASHSWGQLFVDDLAAFEHLGEEAVIWICCFAMTQDDERLELLNDFEVFAEALTAPTTVAQVLILDEELQAFQRMWVLFEVLRAYQWNKELQIVPPDLLARSRLMECAIELGRAKCTKPEDERYIRAEFEKVGLWKVNTAVRNIVLDSLRALVSAAHRDKGSNTQVLAAHHLNLGQLLVNHGMYGQAEKEVRHALDLRVAHQGVDHLAVAECKEHLGSLLRNQKRLREAETELRGALAIQVAHFGEDMKLCEGFRQLGNILADLEEFDEAEDMLRRALRIAKECSKGAEIGSCYNSLACLLEDRNLLAEAADAHQCAIQVRIESLGEEHPDVAQSMTNLGSVLLSQGKLEGAEANLRHGLAIRIAQLGDTHPAVASSRCLIGTVLSEQERFEEAEIEHKLALKIRIAKLGEDHPYVERSRKKLQALHETSSRNKSAAE